MIGGDGNADKKGFETLTVTHGRNSCDCHRHYHHHYRHRCRRRTSSCERISILERDSGPDSANDKMCRSKSNVEICMFRRKRSKGRREPSTSSTSSEVTYSDGGGSSSESFCRYNKNDRRKRDGHRNVGKEKSNGKAERKSSLKKGKKSPTAGESARTDNGNDGGKKGIKKSEKNQQKEKPSANNEQQVAVDAKRNEQIPEEKLPEVKTDKKIESLPPSLETQTTREFEQPVAASAKQDSLEQIAAGTEAPSSDKTIVTVADVHTPTTAEFDAVPESAEKIVTDVEITTPNLADESAVTKKPDEKDALPTVTVTDESSKQTPVPETGENVTSQETSNANDETPSKQSDENEKVEIVDATKEPTVKFDEKTIEKSADTGNIDAEQSQSIDEKQSADAIVDPKMTSVEPGDGETVTAANAPSTDDASKGLQVLPSGGDTNANENANTNQVSEDAGLVPPKTATESVRKTSFTVLNSEESMDDILGVVDESNQNAPVKSVKVTLPRPKSFKVLSEMDASGADILLQQSSDQEKSGNEDDDDYLNGNALANQRSGKYSDSELIKFDGNANGRRKKYKKRAKSSVRQLSIANASTGGGSNQSLNKQQSRDQDSGFEPSPRAMRTIKSSAKTIYTTPLAGRPRVGDVIDSRFEQRKPGDKNAVNMSTVSQTLQRNIRRLSDSHFEYRYISLRYWNFDFYFLFFPHFLSLYLSTFRS